MSSKQGDILNTQNNAGGDQNREPSSKLIHREKIEGTPFEIIGDDENGWFLSVGKFKLTENKATEVEARMALHDEMWNIILNLIVIFNKEIEVEST